MFSTLLTGLLATVTAVCSKPGCERFDCSAEPFPLRPIDPYIRPSTFFGRSCSCLPDWNAQFCNHTRLLVSAVAPATVYPSICICRNLRENGRRCEQFITRCYKRSVGSCGCCFNQPDAFCDHLACKNNEPEFSSSNTTCECFHNPREYPFQICSKNSESLRPTTIGLPEDGAQAIKLFGREVHASIFLGIVVLLVVAVFILTAIILIVRNRRLSRQRESSSRRRQAAQETFLLRQAEDDKYLPNV